MSQDNLLGIFGEIIVDVILGDTEHEHKMRLGGVVHAARAAWAAGYNYEVYYAAPLYLEDEIRKYLLSHGCRKSYRIGDIDKSPGVILVGEPRETGDQGYSILMTSDMLTNISDFNISGDITKILIFPGKYSLAKLLHRMSFLNESVQFYIDIANGIDEFENLSTLSELGRRFECVFNSTSFHMAGDKNSNMSRITERVLTEYGLTYIMKENRGGGIMYLASGDKADYPAFPREISHSVGVGDCFDVVFAMEDQSDPRDKLKLASYLASEYASTSFPDDLLSLFSQALGSKEIIYGLDGIRLSWERRRSVKIYVAAPDFDWVDDRHIRKVENALKYHNFSPMMPIKENGQIDDFDNHSLISSVFEKDILMIHECDILLAVIINDDHGTLIEVGYAKGLGKNVVVYDPNRMARNPMLTCLPDLISDDLDVIIGEVFKYGSTI